MPESPGEQLTALRKARRDLTTAHQQMQLLQSELAATTQQVALFSALKGDIEMQHRLLQTQVKDRLQVGGCCGAHCPPRQAAPAWAP